MGYGTRNNGQIDTFWPDDTENIKHIAYGCSLARIQTLILEWWPTAKPEEISITTDYIQTDCLTYDLYDSGDWKSFIVIERNVE